MNREPIHVDLRRFHDASDKELLLLAVQSPRDLLAPLVGALEQEAKRAAREDERVRVGLLVRTWAQGEIGIFLRRGSRVGASIGLRWLPDKPLSCEVRVGPLSAASAWLQWGSLAGGIVLGFILTKLLLQGIVADPRALFLIALFVGIVIAVALLAIIVRTGAFSDAPACLEVALRLGERVRQRLEPRRDKRSARSAPPKRAKRPRDLV